MGAAIRRRGVSDAPVDGITAVTPDVVLPLVPAFLAARAVRPALRSFGLMNSSIPKLMSASPVPSIATQIPGGAHHHHQPPRTALFAKPSRSISPQFHSPGGDEVGEPARPRNAIAVAVAAARRPASSGACVDARTCDQTSCAKTVVPSQCAVDGPKGSG